MKLSKGLQSQMDRLTKTGSFALNMNQKRELQTLIEETGYSPLTNLDCGVCVRNALHNLNAYLQHFDAVPVLQMNKKMTMDVKNENLSFNELRKKAKAKGMKFKNPTKQQLIDALNGK